MLQFCIIKKLCLNFPRFTKIVSHVYIHAGVKFFFHFRQNFNLFYTNSYFAQRTHDVELKNASKIIIS